MGVKMAWEGLAGLVDRWRRREAMQGDVSAIASEAALVAPPYVRALAVHEQTTRWVSACALCVGVGLVGLVAYQQYRIAGLVSEVRTKEYLVVPGAADFVPVRANMISDRVVTEFADYFSAQMVSVTARNIEHRYDAMARFLTPELEARLTQELSAKAELLRALHGAEVWDVMGKPSVRRFTSPDGKSMFEATLRGRVARYALGEVLKSDVEVVTLTFQTRTALGAEEPWVFEVTDFVRRSEDEHRRVERSHRIAAGGSDGE
jgi:hypothetical protein